MLTPQWGGDAAGEGDCGAGERGADEGLPLSDTASASPDYTARIVGHFLRKLYTDMLEEGFPERLKPLIEKLDAQEQANRH